jgi:hypothetical protein
MLITGVNLDLSTIKNMPFTYLLPYDLNYKSTKVSDYKITDEEILDMVDSAHYLGNYSIRTEAQYLILI